MRFDSYASIISHIRINLSITSWQNPCHSFSSLYVFAFLNLFTCILMLLDWCQVFSIWQGQFKSTLVCPVCNKVSITFDPFMYLSLPLQLTITRTMTITVFTCDGSALPSVCTVTVPKQGRFRDLILALSSACSLKQNEKLLLVEVCSCDLSEICDGIMLCMFNWFKSFKSLVHR